MIPPRPSHLDRVIARRSLANNRIDILLLLRMHSGGAVGIQVSTFSRVLAAERARHAPYQPNVSACRVC